MDTKRRSSTDPTMATDAEETGFVSRWSRRKAQARQGAVLIEPAAPAPVAPAVRPPPTPELAVPPADPEVANEPLPTLADVAELTHESDYTRFVVQGVRPEVKNAALKKLFTDPHFNVMDGLDTYIDDYGKPDPLPVGMLRQMVQSKMLGLFAEEEEEEEKERAGPPTAAPPTPETAPDEDTDLRLQPDDDAGRTGPEPGAGEDAGRQH